MINPVHTEIFDQYFNQSKFRSKLEQAIKMWYKEILLVKNNKEFERCKPVYFSRMRGQGDETIFPSGAIPAGSPNSHTDFCRKC